MPTVTQSASSRQWGSRFAAVAVLAATTLAPAVASAVVRSGPQEPLTRGYAKACVDGSGRIAVVYRPIGSEDLFLQAFDAFGAKSGVPVVLLGGGAFDTDCAVDGEIVVTWTGQSDGDGLGIFGQIFDATGSPLTSAFPVNEDTTGHQVGPRVSVSDADELLFAWGYDSFTAGSEEARARLFDLTGTALGSEQTVQTVNKVADWDVAALTSGDYAVAWTDLATKTILMRRIDALGAPVGVPVTIAPAGAGFPDENEQVGLARLPGGGFLASWIEILGQSARYVARRFDDDGAPTGGEILLQTGSAVSVPTAADPLPLVGVTADGGLVAVSRMLDGSYYGVSAQIYDATDAPVGDRFLFNTNRIGDQTVTSLAVTGDGDFLATWRDWYVPSYATLYNSHVAFICAGLDPTCDPCLGAGTVDSDGDGLPDECDPCTRLSGSPTRTFLDKSVLKVRRAYQLYRYDRFELKARFLLPPALAFSDLDLVGQGMQVIVSAPGVGHVVDSQPGPGAFDKSNGVGWRASKNGRKYRYRDKHHVTIGGIGSVTVLDRSRGAPGGEVRLKIKGLQEIYPLMSLDNPAEVIVVLGDAAASLDGRCVEAELDLSECSFDSGTPTSGASLHCREN